MFLEFPVFTPNFQSFTFVYLFIYVQQTFAFETRVDIYVISTYFEIALILVGWLQSRLLSNQ